MEEGRGKREEKCKVQNGYAPNEINESNVHDIKNL